MRFFHTARAGAKKYARAGAATKAIGGVAAGGTAAGSMYLFFC